MIPVTSTRYTIDALKLPTVTPWHAWYDDEGQVIQLHPSLVHLAMDIVTYIIIYQLNSAHYKATCYMAQIYFKQSESIG